MKIDRLKTKKQRYRQKSKRRYIARIRKAVGDKTKVKEPKRAKKRRRLLTLQAIKKLEELNRTKLAHELRRWQKPRSTPDLEEEEPTYRTTKRHRNRGQRSLEKDSETEAHEDLELSTEAMEEQSRGHTPLEPD